MAGNTCSGRKNWTFVKIPVTPQLLSLHGALCFQNLFKSYKYQETDVAYIFLEGN